MLCSASVSALQIVFSNSLCESTAKWETSDFQRGQNVGARLAGASVTKMATLFGLSRAVVSKVMATYTHIMGGHHQLRGIVIKNQN